MSLEQPVPFLRSSDRPMLGFKSFWSAAKIIAGIETMHMIKKGQMTCPLGQIISAADQFYSPRVLIQCHRRRFGSSVRC